MIEVYSLEQSDKWDSIVRSFEKYDVYWLSGYAKAFQIHGDGEPLLFYYYDNDVRGINVVMKRDIADDPHFIGKIETNTFYDFSTPYGYGGWIIEGENVEGLFSEYHKWLKENKIVSEFVRFHPMIKNHLKCVDAYDVIQLGEVVHMDLSSSDIIMSGIAGRKRTQIRKALRNGIKVFNGRSTEIFEYFKTVYDKTMEYDNADNYYFFENPFYDSICSDLPMNAQVFYVEAEDTVVAAAIALCCNGYMNYHLGGSLREYSSLTPMTVLFHHMALWGYENGYRTLYLGGGVGSGEDSLFHFKRAFYRGDLNHFYIGKMIYDLDKYEELMQVREEDNKEVRNNEYFPQYRG